MRKVKKACLTGLMSLALLSTLPAIAAEYICAEGFADANGISHQWFPIQKMLIMRKGLISIKFRVGENTAVANEKIISISAPPKIQNNLIYVPSDALESVFKGATLTTDKSNQTNSNQVKPIPPKPAPRAVEQSRVQQTPVEVPTKEKWTQPLVVGNDAILLALRHSLREDHTRVVLEFSSPVNYNGDFKNGIYRLSLTGCKNLIPTKRTNPVGRDISKLDLNSGPNREGLILTFALTQKDKEPIIETVADPYRIIISLPLGTPVEVTPASSTAVVAPPKVNIENFEDKKEVVIVVEEEKAPEISIEVPLESLKNQSFKGRTIVIDAGHGGIDHGFVYPGRPSEKEINLEIAKHLKLQLESVGFRAVLLRSADTAIAYSQRLTLANKTGGDLHISIHTGGSKDRAKHGVACYTYSNAGVFHNPETEGPKYDAVYAEWLKSTRFDLAEFLAKKINARLTKHLETDSRGVTKCPMLPLKFIMNPAVLVEVGMLSDKVEGKNLISDKYRLAVAKSITNAVVDFFNGIELK